MALVEVGIKRKRILLCPQPMVAPPERISSPIINGPDSSDDESPRHSGDPSEAVYLQPTQAELELAAAQAQIARLKTQIKSLRRVNAELHEQIDSRDEEIAELKDNNERLTDELNEQKEISHELQQQIENSAESDGDEAAKEPPAKRQKADQTNNHSTMFARAANAAIADNPASCANTPKQR